MWREPNCEGGISSRRCTYFELAERETQLTENDNTFSNYGFNLFEMNFWNAVQVNAAAHPHPDLQRILADAKQQAKFA